MIILSEISSSVYNIEKKWLEEVAPKYFNVDEINLLQVGLFGYINEVMANSVEDNMYMLQVLSNEIFPNKAVLPNSIYSYAALAKYEDFNAKPASIPFILAIRKEDILKYADDRVNYKEIVISRYSKLMIEGEIPFMLDYDIRIIARLSNDKKDYILSAQYVFDIRNPISDIKTPYIKTIVLTEEREEFLFLRLDAHQIDRLEKKYMVYSNDIIENLNYEVPFEGTLADFNVYYREPNSDNYIQLEKYFVDSYKPEEEYFCFFNYTGENIINISFSAHPNYFKPEFNSELLVEIFVTLGSKGNFTYTGDLAEFSFHKNDFKKLSKLTTFTQVLGDSKGGLDKLFVDEIKKNIVKEFSTRGNLITESDLNNYFNSMAKNCNIYFVKKRDDLIKRIYSTFLLLRDKEDNIIPTNTIHLRMFDEEFDNYVEGSNINTLKAGTLFKLEDREGNIAVKDPNIYSESEIIDLDLDPENYFYSCPFLIKLSKDPFFVSYYLNSVFDTYILNYSYSNKNALDEFVINGINITRNSITSNDYKLRLTLTTSIDMAGLVSFSDGEITDLDSLKLKGFIKENKSYTGYINFELVDADKDNLSLVFEATLTTNDFINTDGKLNLTSCVYKCNPSEEIIFEGFNIGNNEVAIDLAIFFNDYEDKGKDNLTNLVPGMGDYCLTNIYSTDDNVQLFKNLNNIMTSTVLLKATDGDDLYYKIKSVPMVRHLYLQQNENMEMLIKLLDEFRGMLSKSLELMENNFNIDMKFYNTYGNSKFFYIGREDELLDKLGLTIRFNIKISGEVNTLLINSIKGFIIDYIERSNNDSINYVYISNLMRELELNFINITFIEFIGFNEYNSANQIIENSFTGFENLSKEQINNFVPEYLNINRIPSVKNGILSFSPAIIINLV